MAHLELLLLNSIVSLMILLCFTSFHNGGKKLSAGISCKTENMVPACMC